jgi:hypothetical protein
MGWRPSESEPGWPSLPSDVGIHAVKDGSFDLGTVTVANVERRDDQPDRQAVALEELIGVIVKRLARLYEGVALVVDLPATLPIIDIDVQIDQVATNLLENAARHTRRDRPSGYRRSAPMVW